MKRICCLTLAVLITVALSGCCCCATGSGLTATPMEQLFLRFQQLLPVQNAPQTDSYHTPESESDYYYNFYEEAEPTEPVTEEMYYGVPGTAELPASHTLDMPFETLLQLNWDSRTTKEENEGMWSFTGQINNTTFVYTFDDVYEHSSAQCIYLNVYDSHDVPESTAITEDVMLGMYCTDIDIYDLTHTQAGYLSRTVLDGYNSDLFFNDNKILYCVLLSCY